MLKCVRHRMTNPHAQPGEGQLCTAVSETMKDTQEKIIKGQNRKEREREKKDFASESCLLVGMRIKPLEV